MKYTFTIIFLFFFCIASFGQQPDEIYMHIADASNIAGDVTYLSHPSLNGNPNAKVLVAHNWNGSETIAGIYNTHVLSVFYDGGLNQWSIAHEDGEPMIENTAYNVFVTHDGDVITHTCTNANQHPTAQYASTIDHSTLNGQPGVRLAITHNYNPGGGSGVFNDHVTGLFYDTVQEQWNLYYENVSTHLNNGESYNIISQSFDADVHRHQATNLNTSLWISNINSPFLNGKPEALFVYAHHWNPPGLVSQVLNNHVTGVYYTSGLWRIFNEDFASMPLNVVYDLVIPRTIVTDINDDLTDLGYHLEQNTPNPVNDQTEIKFYLPQTDNVRLTMYNLVGQRVAELLNEQLPAGAHSYIWNGDMASGTYLYELKVDGGTIVKKMNVI